MSLPKDSFMLLSVVNTKLRDYYSSLDELCSAENVSRAEVENQLSQAGYNYDENINQFVWTRLKKAAGIFPAAFTMKF